MPEDPNKKMDDLLKAYAKERRKGPELNLHPATRQMLQSEVTRVFGGRNPGGSWFHRIRSFWPQLAFGASLCLILGIVVLSLRQQPSTQRKLIEEQRATTVTESIAPGAESDRNVEPFLKKADKLKRTESEELRQLKEQLPRPAPAPEPSKESLAEVQLAAPTTPARDTALFREGAAADSARATPSQVGSKLEDNVALKDQAESKASARYYSLTPARPSQAASADTRTLTAGSRPAAQAAPTDLSVAGLPPAGGANAGVQISPAEKLARANEMTNLGAARRLQFVQAADAPASPPTAMFASFQMEQLGTNVRFFDNDGSVYFGAFEQPTNVPANVLADTVVAQRQRLREEERSPRPPTNAAGFAFVAQGTNRTLGKNVVLTGQYFERTNSPTPDTLAILPKTQPAARGAQAQQAQRMIIGTAVIGNTNQVPVRAVSRD